ncbi:MAG: hypothetical protein ACR2FF_00010 [Mycobacteriales bacterium]
MVARPLKGWARKDTALADTESVDHPTVDVTGLGEQFVEVLQPAGDPEVTGVVDHGFDPERPAFFEIALDPGVPEVGVEGDLVTGAQQPGPVARIGSCLDVAAEDDLHLLGTAPSSVDSWSVEHQAAVAS